MGRDWKIYVITSVAYGLAVMSNLQGRSFWPVLSFTEESGLTQLISGATAALITTALGEAYILLMTQIFKGEMSVSEIGTEKGREGMAKLFTEQLKLKEK